MNETIPIRNGEGIDKKTLKQFVSSHLLDIPATCLEVRQYPSGKSNLTYEIRFGEWEAVLRRPPLGPLPPKAHDMKREYDLLNNLHTCFPLAPKPYIYCDDETIIGSPFYIMERKKGQTINDNLIRKKNMTIQDKQHISQLMVDAIVELHNVDYKKAGLEKIGYPQGFIERRLQNWINRYDRYKTDEIKVIDNLIKWLTNNIPNSQEPTLIHHDFKLNNVLLSDDSKSITAILDWEMATIGDPLFDLAASLSYWVEEKDSDLLKNSLETTTAQTGFISRRQFIERYADTTNRDISSFNYYLALAYFKIAVTQQQIYYRYKTGATQDHRFAKFYDSVKNLITYAEELTHNKNL
ncbi:phosphotransferase family protein [Bacillus sp. OK048]|uniref:phosphotransferase family protein n=1 Tax=Bacillus sp. OK048 TaxID=1882761 RepID=UPI000886115A|nr:phosphotransferase family protein [Bacillus sp. OK048]SDN31807.1 Predicted kinase, aminoglycoside phosphotransferase (APT) family [Bacillus sp. OK048]